MASVITKLFLTPPRQRTKTRCPTPYHQSTQLRVTPQPSTLHIHTFNPRHQMFNHLISVSISLPSLASIVQNTPFSKIHQPNKVILVYMKKKRRENMNVQKAKCDDLLHLICLTNTSLRDKRNKKNKTKEKVIINQSLLDKNRSCQKTRPK